MNQSIKPGRPLGVSLAIFTSGVLFVLLPFAQVAMILLLRMRIQTFTLTTPDGEVIPLASGGTLTDIPDTQLVLQVFVAIVFLIILILAWRGRPQSIRYIHIFAVLLLLAVNFVATSGVFSSDEGLQAGVDSAEQLGRSLSQIRLVLQTLVTLYVVWYMNRAPARNFYRGQVDGG
ncbi:MAG: hypothetical protein CUN54_00495 [Phototrophicales bacterium]|nr:MAG: hypothetical protein CUN54_00495 [Phototrophicales bacterium]